MNDDDPRLQRVLRVADGYAELGLGREAWDELDTLPPELILDAGVLRRRRSLLAAHDLTTLCDFPSPEEFARVQPRLLL